MIRVTITISDRLERILVGLVLAYRWLRYGYAFRRIPLSKGKYAIVDPDDYCWLSAYKWHVRRCGQQFYAYRTFRTKDRKKRAVVMHREIMKASDGVIIDHANRNGLDNRRANLREATPAQNAWNRGKCKKRCKGSKFKGVFKCVGRTGWQGRIKVEGKSIFVGYFKSEIEAAKAYDAAAKKHHGEFAALNFPDRRWRRRSLRPHKQIASNQEASVTISPDQETL